MVPERRAYLRKVITATAVIDAAGERIEGFCHNVSRGGCFLATTSVVPVGKELDVEIRLSGGAIITAKGRVVWARETGAGNAPAGMAVAFLEIAPEALATIGQLAAPPARVARSQTVIGVAPPAAATIAAAIKKRDDALLKEMRAAELSWTEVPLPSPASEPPPAAPPAPPPQPEPHPQPLSLKGEGGPADTAHEASPVSPAPPLPSGRLRALAAEGGQQAKEVGGGGGVRSMTDPPTPTPTAPPAVAEPTEPAPPTLSDEVAPSEPPPPPIESLAPPPLADDAAEPVLTAPTAPLALVNVIPPPPVPSSPWAVRAEPPIVPALGPPVQAVSPKNNTVRWVVAGAAVLLLGLGLVGGGSALFFSSRPTTVIPDAAPIAEAAVVTNEEEDATSADATLDVHEAGELATDVRRDASALDASKDAGHDAGRDAGRDAGHDAGRDAGRDAGHPKDAGKLVPKPKPTVTPKK